MFDFRDWDEASEAGQFSTAIDRDSGELQLTVEARNTQWSIYAPDRLRHDRFILEVEARPVSEPAYQVPYWYGLAFLVQPRGPQAEQSPRYVFEISTHGNFRVQLVNPDGTAQSILPGTTSAAILGAGNTNRLTVICRDGMISVGVNGTTVGTYPDPDINPGEIGIAVGSTFPGGATAAFKNLRLLPLR